MVKTLSADPGMTTGITIEEKGSFSFWEIDSRNLRGFWQFLHDVEPDEIIYEDFKHRPEMMKAELYSVQVIGVIRLYAELKNVPIVFTCLPAEAKAFWDNAKIKKLGLWLPGKGHAMDALRVYLTYRQKTNLLWASEILYKLK